MSLRDRVAAWDQVAARYQERHALSTESAHYGPFAPPERELRLLGPVAGLRILDVGCGGGQSAIAFAKEGASVAGCDPSAAQIAFARALAAAEGVDLSFSLAPAEELAPYASGAWDIVFCASVLLYVERLDAALAECARVLRPGGRLVISVDHPVRDCFFDEQEEEMAPYPVRSYFDGAPMRWRFADSGVPMTSYRRTFAQWTAALEGAGFVLRRLVEPEPPAALLDELWPEDGALAALRHIPQTAIFVAEKRRLGGNGRDQTEGSAAVDPSV